MIIIADAGPLLHLHWVGAQSWALPPQRIEVVDAVWREVRKHAPDALDDARLHHSEHLSPPVADLSKWRLDAGESAALQFALALRSKGAVLVLCDEQAARTACQSLAIPVTGTLGLVVEANRSGRVDRQTAEQALRELPGRGRLHVSQDLVEVVVQHLR
jgi:predicted nucleic acid-binding protein